MRPLKIRKLQVKNFRNIAPQLISFSPGVNCILGDNGQGKTNLLEAIYTLITKKSFRKNTGFLQYLKRESPSREIHLSAVFEEEGTPIPYSGKINEKNSQWWLEGRSVRHGLPVGVVFIHPFEGHLFHTTPSVRREWADMAISRTDTLYKRTLALYQNNLRFRNTLLNKRPPHYRQQIKAVDDKLVEKGIELILKRQHFLKELNPFLKNIFSHLFHEQHQLQITLESQEGTSTPESYRENLSARLPKDEKIGFTTYGAHRDQYTLLFNGLNSFDYCSLGQQKMAYLALLFAYVELFRYKLDSYPIVLLDDVSGELDEVRWMRLVHYLGKRPFQILMTTANEFFGKRPLAIEGRHQLFVREGIVSQESSRVFQERV